MKRQLTLKNIAIYLLIAMWVPFAGIGMIMYFIAKMLRIIAYALMLEKYTMLKEIQTWDKVSLRTKDIL